MYMAKAAAKLITEYLRHRTIKHSWEITPEEAAK